MNNKRKSVEKIEKVFLELIQKKEVNQISVSKICELAKINRTTFYANYLDIYDLVDKLKVRMINKYADIFKGSRGHTEDNYLLMFQHIKDNQAFYRTYFKLGFDINYDITYFDEKLAKEIYNDEFIDYHCEFFRAGITAIIKMWLNNNCKESPEEILKVIKTEYNAKKDETS